MKTRISSLLLALSLVFVMAIPSFAAAKTCTFDTGSKTSAVKQSGKTLALPAKPTKSGYVFKGWYTKKSGGKKVTAKTKLPASTKTYYAHWTKASTTYKNTAAPTFASVTGATALLSQTEKGMTVEMFMSGKTSYTKYVKAVKDAGYKENAEINKAIEQSLKEQLKTYPEIKSSNYAYTVALKDNEMVFVIYVEQEGVGMTMVCAGKASADIAKDLNSLAKSLM